MASCRAGKQQEVVVTEAAGYAIDQAAGIVIVTCRPGLTVGDVLKVQEALRNDPAFHPSHGLIFDTSGAQLSGFDGDSLRRLAENSPFDARARRAFLVSRDIDFGLLRMFQAYSEAGERGELIRVVRDLSAARQWASGGTSD